MKKLSVLLICMLVSLHLAAQYYPEGTKWTEIRLDTLKYDSWFSEDGTPNYEVRKFYIKGQTETKDYLFNNVYIKRENESDSLAFYVTECEFEKVYRGTYQIYAAAFLGENESKLFCISEFYMFDWLNCNWEQVKPLSCHFYFGGSNSRTTFDWEDENEKEDYFGGDKSLTYVNVQAQLDLSASRRYGYDVCLIQGIGVTSWPGPDCIFGPIDTSVSTDTWTHNKTYHPYRSMLIYFERNGEVLYNMQPTPASVKGVPCPSVKNDTPIYDLSGRQLPQKPTKGIYIQNGKKVLSK